MTRRIVVNAVNLFGRGSRTILEACVDTLDGHLPSGWEAEIYVGDPVGLVASPHVRITTVRPRFGRWLGRLHFELFSLHMREAGRTVDVFLSLQNGSARINATLKAAYCGQNLPLARLQWHQAWKHKKYALLRLAYACIYRFGIGKNTLVIVQQQCTRQAFAEMYDLHRCIVARPVEDDNVSTVWRRPARTPGPLRLLCPLAAFPHKDVETAIAAARELARMHPDFVMNLTIDPAESRYASALAASAADVPQIRFIGLLSRSALDAAFADHHLLIYPSLVESWGLPLTEGKAHGIGIVAVDLPYARETVGSYDGITFFPPRNAIALAHIIYQYWTGDAPLGQNLADAPPEPYAENWAALLRYLIAESSPSQ